MPNNKRKKHLNKIRNEILLPKNAIKNRKKIQKEKIFDKKKRQNQIFIFFSEQGKLITKNL